MTRLCTFEGCGRKSRAHGLCTGHLYQRSKGRELTPIGLPKKRMAPIVRYTEAPCPNPNLVGPCHLIVGFKPGRYGSVWDGTMNVKSHRYVWEQVNGPIPPNLVIDHQCRNRGCCNVNHLRVVTAKVNGTENVVGSAWQLEAAKTHCPQGHPYDAGNTYRDPAGGRRCRTCQRGSLDRKGKWFGKKRRTKKRLEGK